MYMLVYKSLVGIIICACICPFAVFPGWVDAVLLSENCCAVVMVAVVVPMVAGWHTGYASWPVVQAARASVAGTRLTPLPPLVPLQFQPGF